jgi:hypothetical protein
MLGATILVFNMGVVVYFSYKRYGDAKEDPDLYDKSQTGNMIDLNSTTNKAIVDYLNTLECRDTDVTLT